MLAVKSIPSGNNSRIADYYEGYLTGENPNQKATDEPSGKWCGSYAEQLQIAQSQVQKGDLKNGLNGYHPRTGEALSNNAGANHKPGHDLTFNAPKSVSIAAAAGSDEIRASICAAQQRAVESTIKYAENSGAFIQREGHAGEHKICLLYTSDAADE